MLFQSRTVILISLKGQCHEIICSGFFSWIIIPQAPENNIRVIKKFSKFAEVFASQGAPPVYESDSWNFAKAEILYVNSIRNFVYLQLKI